MSVAEQIQALTTDRTAIQNAISTKGGTITENDGFDDFATAIGTIPTGGGSGLLNHTISLTLGDNTVVDIDVDYYDPLISTMITSYIPETYDSKNVVIGALDNVEWFNRSRIS